MNRLIPALAWLRGYDRAWLRGDVAAGIAVTALVVPLVTAWTARRVGARER